MEVRGKSFSGHTIHVFIRWYSARDAFARFTMGSASACTVSKYDRGAGLCISITRQWDHNSILHFRLAAQGGFEIVGIDVHSCRSDDDIFLSALEIKIAIGIKFADVAGAIPSVFAGDGMQIASVPVAGGDSASAHQDFSVWSQFDFASSEDFSNRSFAQPKRVVHAYERRGFGEAVALNGGVAEASPEFFGVAVEGGAAGDEGPEFPSELTMDAAEDPPAVQEVFAFGGAKLLPELFATALSSRSRSIFSLRDCSTRGTATNTETRSRWIVPITSPGLSVS